MATAQAVLLERLLAVARADPRIAGVLDYGSASYGRADQWSDLDLTLFIRDDGLPGFEAAWEQWATSLGDLLLAYRGHYGNPWTVYAAEPLPLQVDFNFYPASTVDRVRDWHSSPVSVAAMLRYDATGGRLRDSVAALLGRSLAPAQAGAEFMRLCGDLWYFILYAESKRRRGDGWQARQAFHTEVMEHLLRLLRLEAGATARWQWSSAAFDIERDLPAERLRRLEDCVPATGNDDLGRALRAAAALGHDTCAATASRHGWPWPERLGSAVVRALDTPDALPH